MPVGTTVLVLATTNSGKAGEIKSAFAGLRLKVITKADLGIRASFPEKGTSFKENAAGKSLFTGLQSDYLTLAEDSGLEVKALGGAPGVYSARYSGRSATDEKNTAKVLRLMARVPADKRQARFVCWMVLSRKGRILKTAHGAVRGAIARERRGMGGFGYDPIFYYRPLKKTFGQLSLAEKNAVSHRGRALNKMKSFLAEYLKSHRP
jgi:XTP/dITP diphosphohydrolase